MEAVLLSGIKKRHIVHICTRCSKTLPEDERTETMCQECRELCEWEIRQDEDWRDQVYDLRYGMY